MIIIGAKGFAIQLLTIFHQLDILNNLVFFDNINIENQKIFDRFEIIHSYDIAKTHFETIDKRFVLGIGNPQLRESLEIEFIKLGGTPHSIISPKSYIAPYQVNIGQGTTIISGSIIDNNVKIGKSCLINTNSTIGHDSVIGNYTEISPGVVISGNCQIGNNVFIGSNATILPKIIIGNNAIIAAGAVVIKNVSENTMVAGNPAVIKKQIQ